MKLRGTETYTEIIKNAWINRTKAGDNFNVVLFLDANLFIINKHWFLY
jgi:hypothetical protein